MGYCGRSGSWMEPILHFFGFDLIFGANCKQHDDDYDKGGSEHDRLRYDLIFLYGMLSRASKEPKWKSLFYCQVALIFYFLARNFGKKSFNYY